MADLSEIYRRQSGRPATAMQEPPPGAIERLIRLATGKLPDELHTEGGIVYPQENNSENQGGHRLAAKLMTDRLGPLASQVSGVANEGWEAVNNKAVGGQWFPNGVDESLRDLGANWRGMEDSVSENPIIQMIRNAFSSRSK